MCVETQAVLSAAKFPDQQVERCCVLRVVGAAGVVQKVYARAVQVGAVGGRAGGAADIARQMRAKIECAGERLKDGDVPSR